MDKRSEKQASLIKRPSAWLPIVMSVTALLWLLGFLSFALISQGAIVREKDEGVGAHVFQLLMVAQLPIIAVFVLKWVPQRPKKALLFFFFQALAFMAAWFPVWYFRM